MSTTQIILALRQRLRAAGYSTHLGITIDPEQDHIPAVSIQIAQGGIQVVSMTPKVKKTISVMVEYIFDTKTADPLLEVLAEADRLTKILVQIDKCKGVDQLDGAAFSVSLQKTIPVLYPERTDLGLVQSILDISYLEK